MQHLVWRFGRLDHETRFGCQTLQRDEAQEVEAELRTFQDATIADLRRKRWLKLITVADMTPDGKKALEQVAANEEGLWQLHLNRHKWRIWGFFEEPEFFFVFWDANHDMATGRSRQRKT